MPTVRYSERRVETTALPGVRRQATETETSAGVGLAEAQARTAGQVARVGEQLFRVGGELREAQLRERKRMNDLTVMAGDTALGKWEYKRIYDPETGAYTVKGKDAMGLPDAIAAEFEEQAGQIERGLTNDDQRREFAKIKAQRALNLYGNISRHTANQVEAYHASELQAKVENGIELAVGNATEPRRVEEEADLVVKAIKSSARAMGWGEEQTTQKVGNALTAIHVGVVENLLDNRNVAAAKEHYEESKELITDPKQRSRIEGMLKTAGVLEGSQTLADKIIAEGGDVDAQLEKARKQASPEERPHVEQRIEHFEQRKKQQEAEKEHALLGDAYKMLHQGTRVDDLPPTMLSALEEHIPALDSYAASRARGEPIQTDQTTFYNLMLQAAKNPAQFSSDALNLLKYRDRLSDGDFQQLTQLKANIISANRKAVDPVLDRFQTTNQAIESTLATYGIDPSPKDETAEAAAIGQLRGMVARRIEALGGDKKVSDTEVRDMVNGILAVQDTVPGSWWNIWPGGKSFTDTSKRLIDVTVEDLAPATRANVEEAMRQQHLPITPATVRDYYIEWSLRQRATKKGGR